MKLESLRLENYLSNGFSQVEGWLDRDVIWLLDKFQAVHDEHNVEGGFAEIGVHHGRLFFALANCARPGELGVAIDIFSDQFLNVDKSGSGNRQIFEAGLQQYCHHDGPILIFQMESLCPEAGKALSNVNSGFRVFSIDGGHTFQHVINDIALAEKHLVNGGLVLVDDFCNPGWPGVTEGVVVYFRNGGSLVPVCSTGNKLFLTTLSYQRAYIAAVSRWTSPLKGKAHRVRTVKLCGHDYIDFKRRAKT